MRIFKYLFVAAEAYSPFDLHYANGIRAYHDQNWALTIQGNMKNQTILQGALLGTGRSVYKVQGFENFSEKGRL